MGPVRSMDRPRQSLAYLPSCIGWLGVALMPHMVTLAVVANSFGLCEGVKTCAFAWVRLLGAGRTSNLNLAGQTKVFDS